MGTKKQPAGERAEDWGWSAGLRLCGRWCDWIGRAWAGGHQVIDDGGPVGETVGGEGDEFAFELGGAVAGAVVDEVVATVEVLVMGKDELLVEGLAKVSAYPLALLHPAEGVVPRGGGEDVEVVLLGEGLHGFDGTWHGVHEVEHAGDKVGVVGIACPQAGLGLGYSALEIDQDAIHIDIDNGAARGFVLLVLAQGGVGILFYLFHRCLFHRAWC